MGTYDPSSGRWILRDQASIGNQGKRNFSFLPRLFKPEAVGSILVTTEFFLISCDSNQVPNWFGTHYNLEVPL